MPGLNCSYKDHGTPNSGLIGQGWVGSAANGGNFTPLADPAGVDFIALAVGGRLDKGLAEIETGTHVARGHSHAAVE